MAGAIASGAVTEAGDASEDDSLFDMSLEELMDVEITSASRQKQKLADSAVPVTVITAEDIHYSGLTNLYEILQFATSIDMIQTDRNRYSLGVRGLHDTWSDRTLTLIDGRVADSPIFGGSEFLRQPLLLEDIKQIEILRGPSGAAWGANAFNGAINIIPKHPEECKGVFVSSGVSHFGDNYHRARWADVNDTWAWRVSTAYEDAASSSDALDRDFVTIGPPIATFESGDFRRNALVDAELRHDLSDRTNLSFGLGHSDMETGGYEFIYKSPESDSRTRTTRAFGKLEKTCDNDQKLSAQWYGTFYDYRWPALGSYSSSENQLEGQWDFSPAANHRSTIGASTRMTDISQDIETSDDVLVGDNHEQRLGAFIVDRWQATERLKIEGQVYGEWYSEVQSDWAARLSASQSLDEQGHHVVRLAGARSYRTPLTGLREVQVERLGGLVGIVPSDDLCNERIWAIEAGYSTRLSPTATLRIDGYYQEYDALIGFLRVARNHYQPTNLGPAEAYGLESELKLHGDFYKLSLWYAYNNFIRLEGIEGNDTSKSVRGFLPARHKAGATLRFFLPDDWTVNLNYKHNSETDASHGPWGEDIPASDRLDATLAKKFQMGRMDGEILLGVADIFNDTEQIAGDQGSAIYQHETPGRTLFATLFLQF